MRQLQSRCTKEYEHRVKSFLPRQMTHRAKAIKNQNNIEGSANARTIFAAVLARFSKTDEGDCDMNYDSTSTVMYITLQTKLPVAGRCHTVTSRERCIISYSSSSQTFNTCTAIPPPAATLLSLQADQVE